QQSQAALYSRTQDLGGARYTRLPGGGESVRVGPTDKNGSRSQADSFHDVAATADTAVHQHVNSSVYGGDNLGQRQQGRRDRIELTASVVRHNHCRSTFIDCALGIVAR